MRLLIATLSLLALANCRGSLYREPLAAAAAGGRTDEVARALAAGADAGAKGRALINAARAGRIGIIRELLRSGADPNFRGGVNDWTPIQHAIHKNQRQAVLALLEGGADVNARGGNGSTALMMAAGYGYAGIVRDLLEHGADPYAEAPDGANALAGAVSGVSDIDRFTLGSCQTETVRALFEEAPALKLKDNFSGRGARWVARLAGCKEVLRLLEKPPAG